MTGSHTGSQKLLFGFVWQGQLGGLNALLAPAHGAVTVTLPIRLLGTISQLPAKEEFQSAQLSQGMAQRS